VESGSKGGSLKTVEFASSYNRDIFAYPGRPTDKWSSGCNSLIKGNKAFLAESAEDILKGMNWDLPCSAKPVQMKLFPEISENQRKLYDLMQPGEQKNIEELTEESKLSISEVLSDLMQMEIKDLVKSLPGGNYLKNNA
jgi:DNA processing protein